jgi:hypothetical protein
MRVFISCAWAAAEQSLGGAHHGRTRVWDGVASGRFGHVMPNMGQN